MNRRTFVKLAAGGIATQVFLPLLVRSGIPSGYALRFWDDFSSVDPSKWYVANSKPGYGQEWFLTSQVSASNSILKLTAEPWAGGYGAYKSGELESNGRFEFQYGYLECRAKMPQGQGLWPIWWLRTVEHKNALLNYSKQEIDIFENQSQLVSTTGSHIHWGNRDVNGFTGSFHTVQGVDYSSDFHIYGLDWKPGVAKFYVDGVLAWEYASVNVPWERMSILLSLSVGGYAGVPHGAFPLSLEVDYVGVWQAEATTATIAPTSTPVPSSTPVPTQTPRKPVSTVRPTRTRKP